LWAIVLTIVILPHVVLAVVVLTIVVLTIWARLELALGLRRALLLGQINQRCFTIHHIMGYGVGLIPIAAIRTPIISAPVLAAILPAVLAIILAVVLGVILPARLLLGGHLAHRFGQ
jgi:hypothetical protein